MSITASLVTERENKAASISFPPSKQQKWMDVRIILEYKRNGSSHCGRDVTFVPAPTHPPLAALLLWEVPPVSPPVLFPRISPRETVHQPNKAATVDVGNNRNSRRQRAGERPSGKCKTLTVLIKHVKFNINLCEKVNKSETVRFPTSARWPVFMRLQGDMDKQTLLGWPTQCLCHCSELWDMKQRPVQEMRNPQPLLTSNTGAEKSDYHGPVRSRGEKMLHQQKRGLSSQPELARS